MHAILRAVTRQARRQKRRLSAAVKASSAQPPAHPPCITCRRLDSWGEQVRVAEVAGAVAAALDIPLWRLPSPRGIRLATADSPDARQRLTTALQGQPITVSTGKAKAPNNKYEFDQVTTSPPARAEWLNLGPVAHCRSGESYLRSRQVTVEWLPTSDGNTIVPRAGLGPRVYDAASIGKLVLDRESPIIPGDPWPFPIDIVYTWVDSSDSDWQELFRAHAPQGHDLPMSAVNSARWQPRDELRYSLRSISMYAPYVRKIFVVTNGQVPKWLISDPMVRVVTHEEIFEDRSCLPTFSSRPIESVLHRIDDLAEHFIYLNDDFFFGAPTGPADFFSMGGVGNIFFSNRHLDERPVGPHDRATVAAHKNTREALRTRFGLTLNRKFKHAPYVMRRTVWQMIEEDFKEALARTRENRFRSWNDLSPVPFLYNHYAHLTGFACPADIGYRYLDVQDPQLTQRIGELEQEVQVFCLNDADSDADTDNPREKVISQFLESRFPVAPSWEA